MASTGDPFFFDLDSLTNNNGADLQHWNLADYSWDSVGLIAKRREPPATEPHPPASSSGGSPQATGGTDEGSTHHNNSYLADQASGLLQAQRQQQQQQHSPPEHGHMLSAEALYGMRGMVQQQPLLQHADFLELQHQHQQLMGDVGGMMAGSPDGQMEDDAGEGDMEELDWILDEQALLTAPVYMQLQGGKCNTPLMCQVAGCGSSLEGCKGYFLRHRLCAEHSKSPVLIIGAVPSRLCQQCSKFHHVSAFEGSKRTCRVQLDRIRVNKRNRRIRRRGGGGVVGDTMLSAMPAGFISRSTPDGLQTLKEGQLFSMPLLTSQRALLMPQQPAAPAAGSKRPADSSAGSGDNSFTNSRKSRQLLHTSDTTGRTSSGFGMSGGSGASPSDVAALWQAQQAAVLQQLQQQGQAPQGVPPPAGLSLQLLQQQLQQQQQQQQQQLPQDAGKAGSPPSTCNSLADRTDTASGSSQQQHSGGAPAGSAAAGASLSGGSGGAVPEQPAGLAAPAAVDGFSGNELQSLMAIMCDGPSSGDVGAAHDDNSDHGSGNGSAGGSLHDSGNFGFLDATGQLQSPWANAAALGAAQQQQAMPMSMAGCANGQLHPLLQQHASTLHPQLAASQAVLAAGARPGSAATSSGLVRQGSNNGPLGRAAASSSQRGSAASPPLPAAGQSAGLPSAPASAASMSMCAQPAASGQWQQQMPQKQQQQQQQLQGMGGLGRMSLVNDQSALVPGNVAAANQAMDGALAELLRQQQQLNGGDMQGVRQAWLAGRTAPGGATAGGPAGAAAAASCSDFPAAAAAAAPAASQGASAFAPAGGPFATSAMHPGMVAPSVGLVCPFDQQRLGLAPTAATALLMQQAMAGAGPAEAGQLLSRLLESSSKSTLLGSELQGVLAEQQMLRQQLLGRLAGVDQKPLPQQPPAPALMAQQPQHPPPQQAMQHFPQQAMQVATPPQAAAANNIAASGAVPAMLPAVPAGMPQAVATPLPQPQPFLPPAQPQPQSSVPVNRASSMVNAAGATSAAARKLDEARAAVSAAAVASFSTSDLLTRMSLKILDCLPDELPPDIRARMTSFAGRAPIDLLQGCLRPGCTEVVMDAVHSWELQRMCSELLHHGDAAAAATALYDVLPDNIRAKELFLQVADRVLVVKPARPAAPPPPPPRLTSWSEVTLRRANAPVLKPQLRSCSTVAASVDQGPNPAHLRLVLRGRNLSEPGVTLLARLGGTLLPVRLLRRWVLSATDPRLLQEESEKDTASSCGAGGAHHADEDDSSPEEEVEVEVLLNASAPRQGLLLLEPRCGFLLGDWLPVLLAPGEEEAEEAEALAAEQSPQSSRAWLVAMGLLLDQAARRTDGGPAASGSWGSDSDGTAAPKSDGDEQCCKDAASGSPPQQRLVARGLDLLAYFAVRGAHCLMQATGEALLDLGASPEALLSSSHNGLPLMACAVLSGDPATASCAVTWAAKAAGGAVPWAEPLTASGDTLLHLAAALPLPASGHVLSAVMAAAHAASPAACDAFSVAWFNAGGRRHEHQEDHEEEGGAQPEPAAPQLNPSQLFRCAVLASCGGGAAVAAAMTDAGDDDDDDGREELRQALLLPDAIDRLAFDQLAAAYILRFSCAAAAPLENVQLPSSSYDAGEASSTDGLEVDGLPDADTAQQAEQQPQLLQEQQTQAEQQQPIAAAAAPRARGSGTQVAAGSLMRISGVLAAAPLLGSGPYVASDSTVGPGGASIAWTAATTTSAVSAGWMASSGGGAFSSQDGSALWASGGGSGSQRRPGVMEPLLQLAMGRGLPEEGSDDAACEDGASPMHCKSGEHDRVMDGAGGGGARVHGGRGYSGGLGEAAAGEEQAVGQGPAPQRPWHGARRSAGARLFSLGRSKHHEDGDDDGGDELGDEPQQPGRRLEAVSEGRKRSLLRALSGGRFSGGASAGTVPAAPLSLDYTSRSKIGADGGIGSSSGRQRGGPVQGLARMFRRLFNKDGLAPSSI